jgi:hypothetical protein
MLGQDLATRPELQRRHVNTNIAIDLNGDAADAVSDLLVYDRVADGPWTLVAVGRYHDCFARQPDGSWLFTRRSLEFV